MFTMAGTIKNSVRMATLDQKWQQKKNSFGQDKKKLTEMTAEERQLQDFREQAEQMRKSQKHANIDAKLAAGEELTPEEIEYLRQNNPQALKDYEYTQRERENYKRALRNCRTKEEVERLKYTKMGQFMAEAKKISSNACIPKGKKVALLKRILQQATAVEDEHKEFLKTSRYASLPTEEEAREAELVMGDITVELGNSDSLDGKIAELHDIMPELSGLSGTLYLDTYDETNSSPTYRFVKKN